MQTIVIPANTYSVAASRTAGIPDHAIEISGPLIEIGKKNLEEWGITAGAVDDILERGVGIPIRVCNSENPHACDLANDRYSQVGYTTKMWASDGWVHASAAITQVKAGESINDGTWTPFGNGSWSVTGAAMELAGDFENSGMIEQLIPQSIALFTPPSQPAFVGSKFEMVAASVDVSAAEWTTAYINSLPDSSFAYIESCYGKTSENKGLRHLPYKNEDGKIDLPHLRNALARVDQIKMSCEDDKQKQDTIISEVKKKLRELLDEATVTAAVHTEAKVTMPEINTESTGPEITESTSPVVETPITVTPDVTTPPAEVPALIEAPEALTQEDLDDAVKTALETQKAEFDKEIAKMTPNADLQPMFASVKADTIDEIKRGTLADQYIEIVTASSILSAPYKVDDKLDVERIAAKHTEMMSLKTASVEQAITDAKTMVAAMPAGRTALDDATIPSNTADAGFNEKMSKLGATSVEFIRGR